MIAPWIFRRIWHINKSYKFFLMPSADLQRTFFFDLPLSDVYGIGCSALRLIYYGSEAGAFGNCIKDAIDLDEVQAFQISLKHRTVEALSDDYSYYLVYYRKDFGVNLWNSRFRKGCPTLRKLTRRVKFRSKPSLIPNRVRLLYIKANRPVHIAQYHSRVPTDHDVPAEYIKEFGEHFEGFLMRCKKDYPLVSSLFDAQGLTLSARRDVAVASKTAPHVRVYSKARVAAEVV